MRTAVLFLLMLCWHLVGGHNPAYASESQHTRHYSAPGKEKLQQVSTADTRLVLQATEWSSLTEDITHVFSIEDDEEEDVTRKHTSWTRYIPAFSCTFLSKQHSYCGTDHLTCGEKLDCIKSPAYIFQRALRI